MGTLDMKMLNFCKVHQNHFCQVHQLTKLSTVCATFSLIFVVFYTILYLIYHLD